MSSRRALSVAVVVVVAVIALAAAIDALRGGPAREPRGQTEAERPSGSTATGPEARAAEFRGTLYYTNESCELRAMVLPGQRPVEAPEWDECRFVLSPDATSASAAGTGWNPRADSTVGRLFVLADGLIQVSTDRGPDAQPFPGTAPAWRPDGTLTYFADRAVREWPGGEIVLRSETSFGRCEHFRSMSCPPASTVSGSARPPGSTTDASPPFSRRKGPRAGWTCSRSTTDAS